MQQIAPPLCFLLAIAMVVTGFSLLAIGLPEASVALHNARASGDDAFTEQLESDLRQQRLVHGSLITLALMGSVLLVLVGFRAMAKP
jgi:hypothetical protein